LCGLEAGQTRWAIDFPLVHKGKVARRQPPQEEMDVAHDLRESGPFIGLGGMAVAAFLYGYTAIAFPSLLHSLGMPVFWLVLFVWTTRWFTTRPLAVIALPVVAVAAWFAVLVGLGPRG
jgi:hypothetical protein